MRIYANFCCSNTCSQKFGEYQWMMEEDRRVTVLAAADAVCFADRQGGDVWLAAAQLDSALLELRPALRR